MCLLICPYNYFSQHDNVSITYVLTCVHYLYAHTTVHTVLQYGNYLCVKMCALLVCPYRYFCTGMLCVNCLWFSTCICYLYIHTAISIQCNFVLSTCVSTCVLYLCVHTAISIQCDYVSATCVSPAIVMKTQSFNQKQWLLRLISTGKQCAYQLPVCQHVSITYVPIQLCLHDVTMCQVLVCQNMSITYVFIQIF